MITVNTNVASINAQRNLFGANKSLNKSLERLSSGLRINRAADDAAGLAISEGLRSQVRGLGQAVRNANDGISLLSTAEAASATTTEMLQRMRELAVQAASDTNSGSNRASLQNEVDQLLSEVTRIGNVVEFNGQKLIDGSFTNKSLQIGAFKGQTIEFSIGDMRATALGKIYTATSTAYNLAAGYSDGDLSFRTSDGTQVDVDKISGYTDGVSDTAGDQSAIAVAEYINAVSGQSGVFAEVQSNVYTTANAIAGSGGNSVVAADFKVNGVQIFDANTAVAANDSDFALRDAINAKSHLTGVTAALGSGNELELTAADGRNIHVETNAADEEYLGFAAAANDVKQMGTYKLISDEGFTYTSAGAQSGFAAATVNVTTAESRSEIVNIKVTTASLAGDAIFAIDNALRQVSSLRSELGAYTNRLESTISNLRTVSENLSASDSRIRDADFAAETANLTKAQILQQAGTAILAQANMAPQAALSLLG